MNKDTIGTKVLSDGSIKIVIPICPRTKKNSQNIYHKNIVSKATGKIKKVPFVAPSSPFKKYEKDASLFVRPLGALIIRSISKRYITWIHTEP